MKKSNIYSYQSIQVDKLQNYKLQLPVLINIIIVFIILFFVAVVILKYFTIISGSFVSFNDGKIGFTLEYFTQLDYAKLSSFKRSIIYSFISAIIGSIIGILVSYVVEKKNKGSCIHRFYSNTTLYVTWYILWNWIYYVL